MWSNRTLASIFDNLQQRELPRARGRGDSGGVLVSAVFTLFLIPVICTKLDRFSMAPAVEPVPTGALVPAPGA